MAHYLLIARFTLDDIPLRLFGHPVMAKDEAKRIEDDPSLLATKWRHVIDMWPNNQPGGFVDALVLQIDELSGYPLGVTYDIDAEDTQSPEPQPTKPTIPAPDGYVEITDPNHKLRPHVDFYLSLSFDPGEWIPITETDAVLISDWDQPGYRFACPATQHPDLQGTTATSLPTETDELTILREANEILVKKQVELVDRIEIFRKANAELLAENIALIDTRTQLHKTVSELLEERAEWMANNAPALEARYRQCEDCVKKLQADLSVSNAQISDLRRLNEDLNHRLNATLARASHATALESRIRGMAVRLLRFAEEIGARAKWSKVFGNEGLMPPAYHKAMAYCWTDFTFQLEEFVRAFPHVSPDMPDHLRIDAIDPGDEADDDDGTTD